MTRQFADPYSFHRVYEANVTMGKNANDGTDDDVRVEVKIRNLSSK